MRSGKSGMLNGRLGSCKVFTRFKLIIGIRLMRDGSVEGHAREWVVVSCLNDAIGRGNRGGERHPRAADARGSLDIVSGSRHAGELDSETIPRWGDDKAVWRRERAIADEDEHVSGSGAGATVADGVAETIQAGKTSHRRVGDG